jgi:hypothetical protein
MERGIGLFMVGDWLVWKIVRENIVTWMWGHVADRTQIVSICQWIVANLQASILII